MRSKQVQNFSEIYFPLGGIFPNAFCMNKQRCSDFHVLFLFVSFCFYYSRREYFTFPSMTCPVNRKGSFTCNACMYLFSSFAFAFKFDVDVDRNGTVTCEPGARWNTPTSKFDFSWRQEHNFHACLATELLGFLFMAALLIMSHISVMQVKEAGNLL